MPTSLNKSYRLRRTRKFHSAGHSRQLEALGRQDRPGRGRGYESNQRLTRFALFAAGDDGGGEKRVVLNRRGQRTNQVDPRRGQDFADLIEPNLDGASGNGFESLRALLECGGFRLHFLGDAQSLEYADHVDADGRSGGWIVPADRLGSKHRAFECLDRTDVRPRSALAHEYADAGLREIGSAATDDLALFFQSLDLRSRGDDHIRGFAFLNAIGHAADSPVVEYHLVPR